MGDRWSMLILRDALDGYTRFDQFQTSLGIAPNMLTRRLNELIDAGLLERRPYSDHPPRNEYILTDAGRDFHAVIVAFYAWGNKHMAPEGEALSLVDTETGRRVEPALVDRISGRSISEAGVRFAPGPVAGPRIRERYGRRAR